MSDFPGQTDTPFYRQSGNHSDRRNSLAHDQRRIYCVLRIHRLLRRIGGLGYGNAFAADITVPLYYCHDSYGICTEPFRGCQRCVERILDYGAAFRYGSLDNLPEGDAQRTIAVRPVSESTFFPVLQVNPDMSDSQKETGQQHPDYFSIDP